ncbi:putative flavonoid 3'-monooxygenase [Rosa chinensis]|uniref:Putative flavonoid 3'-monooxygenase n=1 Tax=Rosa chinensis TaxID=74649 RepID=A0A2P6RKP3_ROSCH|nr:putative flavonoid 3'-monooxygenase [Rosa chinensis]
MWYFFGVIVECKIWNADFTPLIEAFNYVSTLQLQGHLILSPTIITVPKNGVSFLCYLPISTLAVIFATLTFLSKVLFPKSHKLNLKFPPGPKPWPIIGNLNLIGPLPHQSLHKLSQTTYETIMQLKFGSYPVVIASSPEIAKRTHDHVFASRPQAAAGKYTTYNYLNISWAPHGPYWRQGRKIYLSELFNSKRLDSFEYIRVEETRAFLSQLCALSGKPVTLKEHLSRLTLSIIYK